MHTIEIGSAVSTKPGVATGFLKIGELPDGRPMEIPIIIVRGARPGPTLWLHGCVHGNEVCGTFIIHQTIRSLKPRTLAGTVIALPILNITAFEASQRMSPFEGYNGGDLNRNFPGQADGSLTQQMAHAIYSNLKKHANYLVDFHTALTDDVRWALFSNLPGKIGRQSEGLARAFGFKSTLPAPPDILAGSAMMTAAKDGIPALIVEAGGKNSAFNEKIVADGAQRLMNVMRHLGMLTGKVKDYGKLYYFSNFAWVTATRGGLFERAVRCGDRIKSGARLGSYFNLYGEPIGDAHSPHDGIVLAIHPGPIMGNGETLVHIGLNPREV